MNSLIRRLWQADNLPVRDGLYRADGAAYHVQVDTSVEGNLKVLAPFSLEAFTSHYPDMITVIDTTLEKALPDGSGYLCCGEGSYGSEGFFGRIDQCRDLVWVVYLENSNPFISARIDGSSVAFTSSAGVTIKVNLGSPYLAGACE